jgi:septal ring factor EnvC (AmiA/AmiB activator)|tara:strand:+ start:2458 stop:3708 length:1251 start_codon:yes stop_codon:yes gene_type:complete
MSDVNLFSHISKAKINSLLILLAVAFLCIPQTLSSQTNKKASLTAEREKIEVQLSATTRLISQAKSNRNEASSRVALIDRQIELREKLIRHHQSSIRNLERSVVGMDTEIRALEGHISALKNEYAMMIQQAYRMKLARNPLLFVFSAEDFSQAALRYKMLQSYAEIRKSQAEDIIKAQQDLSVSKEDLNYEKVSILDAIQDQENERDALNNDRDTRAELLSEIKREEKRLRIQLKVQEKEHKRLSNEIKRIIEAELAAERASAAGEYALTPEGKIISEKFEKNKSNLPWPVATGVVTKSFGRHKHATIAGITVESNGIDITTEKGAKVFSIFSGTVSSVFSFPGAGETVIVTHGGYRTVYSNLDGLSVKKGDVIERATVLGEVWSGPKGVSVHFEVWKVAGSERSPQDPKSWLSPR